jgi:hypothetical protein
LSSSSSSSTQQHYNNESEPKLFGIFATHSPESCPMNNQISKKIFMQIEDKIRSNYEKYSIKNIVGFYMSVLEHQWIIIISAENVHQIESMCIEAGISSYNTIKIVPLNSFDMVIEKMKMKKMKKKNKENQNLE